MRGFVAYLRVSTQKQGKSGLGLLAQQQMVDEYVKSVGGTVCASYTEVESGKLASRPELAKALAACRIHGATLVTAKLDRLSRNVAFVSNLLESGCEFVATDFPQANRFMLHLLAAVSEYEAKMISDRTRKALAQAKKRGVQLGGDRGNILDIQRKGSRAGNAVRSEAAQQRRNDLQPVLAELRASGAVSLSQIADGLNRRGIATSRGCGWSPASVYRIMHAAQ